jgi:hypothetical protein
MTGKTSVMNAKMEGDFLVAIGIAGKTGVVSTTQLGFLVAL